MALSSFSFKIVLSLIGNSELDSEPIFFVNLVQLYKLLENQCKLQKYSDRNHTQNQQLGQETSKSGLGYIGHWKMVSLECHGEY